MVHFCTTAVCYLVYQRPIVHENWNMQPSDENKLHKSRWKPNLWWKYLPESEVFWICSTNINDKKTLCRGWFSFKKKDLDRIWNGCELWIIQYLSSLWRTFISARVDTAIWISHIFIQYIRICTPCQLSFHLLPEKTCVVMSKQFFIQI